MKYDKFIGHNYSAPILNLAKAGLTQTNSFIRKQTIIWTIIHLQSDVITIITSNGEGVWPDLTVVAKDSDTCYCRQFTQSCSGECAISLGHSKNSSSKSYQYNMMVPKQIILLVVINGHNHDIWNRKQTILMISLIFKLFIVPCRFFDS